MSNLVVVFFPGLVHVEVDKSMLPALAGKFACTLVHDIHSSLTTGHLSVSPQYLILVSMRSSLTMGCLSGLLAARPSMTSLFMRLKRSQNKAFSQDALDC